jgi:hypothetical protein
LRQRPLVEKAAQVVRRVDEYLGLADAAEQRVVLLRCLRHRGGAHRCHQRLPRRLEVAARLGSLRDRHLELLQQRLVGRCQPGQQAVQLGAREFFAAGGGGKAQGW